MRTCRNTPKLLIMPPHPTPALPLSPSLLTSCSGALMGLFFLLLGAISTYAPYGPMRRYTCKMDRRICRDSCKMDGQIAGTRALHRHTGRWAHRRTDIQAYSRNSGTGTCTSRHIHRHRQRDTHAYAECEWLMCEFHTRHTVKSYETTHCTRLGLLQSSTRRQIGAKLVVHA